MAQTLQAKVQMVGLLLAVFVLLSLPLFAQVRADVADSASRGNDTVLGRMFQDLFKNVNKDPPSDLDVEDAWGQWQKDHPDCSGPQCDEDGDLDGDGISNKDEIAQGRNPDCNEEVEGADKCAGKTPTPTTTPTTPTSPTPVPMLHKVLFHEDNIVVNPLNPVDKGFTVTKVTPDYDRWILFWNASALKGTGAYKVILKDASGMELWSQTGTAAPGVDETDQGRNDFQVTSQSFKSDKDYKLSITTDGTLDGRFELDLLAHRNARAAA